jgi:hypothetical protein
MPMRRLALASSLVLSLLLAGSAHATVPVVFGTSWDGPTHTLQKIIDTRYGAGKINVTTDFIGAHPGDIDPWFWVGSRISALLVTEVAGNADHNTLGWYTETFTKPTLTRDGLHDGIVFDGPASSGATTVVVFPQALTKFGFFLDPNGPVANEPVPSQNVFFSNRFYNGTSAVHAPYDGNVQALVFDLSGVVGANTWLVCFEDRNSGQAVTPCCTGTDNDFNDFVFEFTAYGATPVTPTSFGALKIRYRP